MDTGATRCVIPKSVNDTIFNLPIEGTNENVCIGKDKTKFDFVIVPKFSLFDIREGKIVLISRENIEAWLGEMFIVGMNFLKSLNITMNNDVITIID